MDEIKAHSRSSYYLLIFIRFLFKYIYKRCWFLELPEDTEDTKHAATTFIVVYFTQGVSLPVSPGRRVYITYYTYLYYIWTCVLYRVISVMYKRLGSLGVCVRIRSDPKIKKFCVFLRWFGNQDWSVLFISKTKWQSASLFTSRVLAFSELLTGTTIQSAFRNLDRDYEGDIGIVLLRLRTSWLASVALTSAPLLTTTMMLAGSPKQATLEPWKTLSTALTSRRNASDMDNKSLKVSSAAMTRADTFHYDVLEFEK